MSEDTVQGVIDTVDAAKDYRIIASELLQHVQAAESQVTESRAAAERHLVATFRDLRALLDKRLSSLLESVATAADCALVELGEVRRTIEDGDTEAGDAMRRGKDLLFGCHETLADDMKTFKAEATKMDTSTLPEAPALCDVCSICIDLQPDLADRMQALLLDGVKVMVAPPVKVTRLLQRPGALLVYWAETAEDDDEACVGPFSEYRLQYWQSSVSTSAVCPVEAYAGPAASHNVRHLSHATSYSFRVCGRVDDTAPWCAWSVPCEGLTTLPHYEWQSDVRGYTVSNKNKMFTRECESGDAAASCSILHSTGTSYTCGHSITFKVFETGPVCADDGIALATVKLESGGLRQQRVVFVNTEGKIYVDGEEMVTQLPKLSRSCSLTFDTTVLSPDKIRVNVEVADKVATFDWCLPVSESVASTGAKTKDETNLFFAANFSTEGWKIGVE